MTPTEGDFVVEHDGIDWVVYRVTIYGRFPEHYTNDPGYAVQVALNFARGEPARVWYNDEQVMA